MRKKAYGRILYVEPNDIVSSNGESIPLDNVSWNPEDLNMAVDLQVIVPRRSDFGSRNLNTGAKSTIEIWHEGLDDVGRYISFMQGADIKDKNRNLIGHELTTDYINASYTEVTSQGQSCKEALGIDSIDITFDQHFYPQVSIKFIDVRGYSLMMPTEEVYRLEHVDAGSDPKKMAEAIYKILQKKKWKVHYKVGDSLQKISTILKRILPDTIYERMLSKHYKV